MKRRRLFCVAALTALCVSASLVPCHVVLAEAAAYTAVTAQDPQIPTDELTLLLKPLTQDELVVEAGAWMALLKAKVHEISDAEIAAKYKSKEIKKAEEAAEAVEKVKEAVEEAEKVRAEKGEEEAAEMLEEAAEAAAEAQAIVESAKEAEEKADKNAGAKAATDAAIEEIKEASAESGEAAGTDVATELSVDAVTVGGAAAEKAEELDGAVAAAQKATKAKGEVKSALLEGINKLRTARTAISDRMNLVLTELEKKGGDAEAYRQYAAAVSKISLEISDTSAAWSTVTGWIQSEEGGKRWAENLAVFLVIVVAFWLSSVVTGKAMYKLMGAARGVSTLMQEFAAKSVRRMIFLVGIIIGLSTLEINIGPLLAIIGAAGFVVAFALQETLGNFASGIMILVYRPFDVGDIVEVAGVTGTVSTLNLVSVTIKTFDNKVVVVPNNAVWGNVITNATGNRTRRIDMMFGIGYADDIQKAQSIMEKILDEHELVLSDPEPNVRLHELADSSVNFICRPWTRTENYWPVYWDVTQRVKEEFDAQGVSIPFPQRDVHLYQEIAAALPGEPGAHSEGHNPRGADFPESTDD